jgi:CheY-like chemotaxis protein
MAQFIYSHKKHLENLRTKDQFWQQVSNDLKTPLTTIINKANLLKVNSSLSQSQSSALDSIVSLGYTISNTVLEAIYKSENTAEKSIPIFKSQYNRATQKLSKPIDEIKLLLVEDNKTNRKILSFQLSQLGIKILEASNDKSAFQLFKEESPDILLLDNLLGPDSLKGADICDQIRQKGYKSEALPIIIISASDTQSAITEAKQKGASDFVSKPYDPNNLKGLIYHHLIKCGTINPQENLNNDFN